MRIHQWFAWYIFGRRIVRTRSGADWETRIVRKTPLGQEYVWLYGLKYLSSERRQFDTVAAPQLPVWNRLVSKHRRSTA